MSEDRPRLIRSIGFLSGLGISMVAASLIGLAMGYYLDRRLGTAPWMTLLFLFFGIAAGFRNLFILTRRELERQRREEQAQDPNPAP